MIKYFLYPILLLLVSSHVSAQIREIPVLDLPDVAIASYDQLGPVIYYNPRITQNIHPVIAKFFRLHEYAHHNLNHLQREQFESNPYNRHWVRQSYEKEADCWAASRLSQPERQLVANFFASTQGPTAPDWYHPTGYERANVIINCVR